MPMMDDAVSQTNCHAAVRCLPGPWLLIALFALALLPMTFWYLVHHRDERHYTDAGITMVQTGDWLTPRCPDGATRFNKPILAYWCVAASYTVMGISPFASRLPFLLAGCGTIWFTYKLGKLLGSGETAGRWAALVAVGNLQIVLAATRSIPDILLCLFTTISCYGVLAIVLFGRRTRANYAAAYIGLGLAVASKGVPAAIVVGAVAMGAIVYGRKWNALRSYVHLPTMAIGAVIAGGWFAAVYAVHGNLSLNEFAHDQVGIRFEATFARRLYHFAVFLGWTALVGLPWAIPLVIGEFRRPYDGLSRQSNMLDGEARRPWKAIVQNVVAPSGKHHPRHVAFAGILCGILALAAATSFCNLISSRYVLPVVPLAAAWLGAAMAARERQTIERTLRWLLPVACLLLVVIGAGLAVANYQIARPGMAAACGIAFLAVAAWAIARHSILGRQTTASDLGLLKLAAFPLITIGLFHFLLPDDGELIARRLKSLDARDQTIQFVGQPVVASKIRVYDRGRTRFDQVENIEPDFRTPHEVLLITQATAAETIDLAGYQVQQFPAGIGRVKERDLLEALTHGQLAGYLNDRRRAITLAVRVKQVARLGVR